MNLTPREGKMKTQNWDEIEGSVTAPLGFSASGVFCDIKRLGTGKGSNRGKKRDLALIVSSSPANVAGMFTTNQICAAPVKVCLERVSRGRAQAVVINSGNANACTGKQGMRDAVRMTAVAAKILGLHSEDVLVGSTGRIGVTLPMTNVENGIALAAPLIGSTPAHSDQVAEAIMTSDTRKKQIAIEFKLGGKTVRMGGICKGAGMIQPGMSPTAKRPMSLPAGGLHATMLCFLTTDARVSARVLRSALRDAVAQSFNRITVDGDMSTNDTVLILANGQAGNAPFAAAGGNKSLAKGSRAVSQNSLGRDAIVFQSALNHVCLMLAKMIVRDGEGTSRFVTVRVSGAKTLADADAAARAVANSALVKTSWCGGDPNWGRIIDALGYSPAVIVEDKVDIGYSAQGSTKRAYSLKRGQPTKTSFKELCALVSGPEFVLHINLNLGSAGAVMYSTDLTEEYVEFNKGDVSDPASLGG
ncbi:MAG: bifunctional glutamate N-acetyltransferase/amino-acid acetyltransferase ArgJ [Verrucomicrobia bacterium]|nr:bifunctional glutamate N-acetyltransferase/amino-acid acetyltransferase ArgJ [Verrucomicrobiota bacterium]